MEMAGRSGLCDFFVVVSAPSSVRVKAIVDHIEESLKKEGLRPRVKEGYAEALWVLLDFGDLILHPLFHPQKQLFTLWVF